MLNELFIRYPALNKCEKDIINAKDTIINCYKNGQKMLLCGNGGSCADCDHIVGELMKGFLKSRPISEEQKIKMKSVCNLLDEDTINKLQCGLPAISLPSITALNSAFCNDVDAELIYAQSIMSLGKAGDVLITISTSGNSKNVFAAAKIAKSLGLTVISLTGESGGNLKLVSDICIRVPEKETYKVQELHMPVYHYLCAEIENYFFKA